MASAKMLKDQTVEVKLKANRSNNMLWGQDGDLSRACRDKRRRRLYSSGGGVEGSCHKQRQKVLGIFEILKHFQKADTEWLRRQDGVVGGGEARHKGRGCHMKQFAF